MDVDFSKKKPEEGVMKPVEEEEHKKGSEVAPILVLLDSKAAKEILSWSDQDGTSVINMESIDELKENDVIFHCYCNGLLCYKELWSSRKAILLNPLKEEIMFLTASPLQSSSLETIVSSYGLGFSTTNGQYNIVYLGIVKNKMDGRYNNIAEVMSLGSPNWTAIQFVPKLLFIEEPVFENGSIYWLSNKHAPQELLVFNVEHERFSTMEFPTEVDKIIDLGGRLGLVVGEDLQVWFSTSHDAEGKITTWGKYDPIRIFGEDGRQIKTSKMELLGVWKDGNILIRLLDGILSKIFISYDFISKRAAIDDDIQADGQAYKTYQSSSLSISEFRGSSEPSYLPPGKTYNPRRSGLIQRIKDLRS